MPQRRASSGKSRGKRPGGGGAAKAPPPSPVELGLRYISRRLRFESEVRTHLRGKKVTGEELERTMARLAELEVLSDPVTCRAWIRDRLHFSPRGRAALRVELRRKGVAAETVEEALEELLPETAEVDVAVEVLRRAVRAKGDAPEAVVRRRMWALLARKGFGSGTVREAVARVLGGTEENE